MDRFVAFVWDPERTDRSEQVLRWVANLRARPASWTKILDQPGLTVLVLTPPSSALRMAPLEDAAGVVVGTLFDAGAERPHPIARLERDTSARIAASGGQDLIDRYWGSYVAFVRDPTTRLLHVVRNPCGGTPCFRTVADGVDILCSFVDDIADLAGIELKVDWDAVGAYFLSGHLINEFTGLAALTELLPGQRLTWRSHNRPERSWVWNPVEIAGKPHQLSFEDTRDAFLRTTKRCVDAWARASGRILVRMSGGLDSSIVASLARQATDGTLLGVHFISKGYEAFELQLAREAATYADIPLIEQAFDEATMSFRAAATGPRVARPTKQLLGADADARLVEVCNATGSQCVMSGHGGDSLFLQRAIAGDALVDYLRLRGLGRDFWRVAYETAMLVEGSVWEVVKGAAGKILSGRRWEPDQWLREAKASPNQVLTRDAITSVTAASLASAWLTEAQALPHGKAEQLRNIVALRNYHPVRGHALTHNPVHPLLSQPLVELSLRTPAYLFYDGGEDRALERSAFEGIIPDSIVRRFSKGFVNHSVIASVASDLDHIRELVLDGACMRSGILDRETVERLLTPEQLTTGDGLGSVMDLIAVESWLAGWRT